MNNQVSIAVVSNKPTNQALSRFQKKLYQLHKDSELKKAKVLVHSSNNSKAN